MKKYEVLAIIEVETDTCSIEAAFTKAKIKAEDKLSDLFPDENVYAWALRLKSVMFVNYKFGDSPFYRYKFALIKDGQ